MTQNNNKDQHRGFVDAVKQVQQPQSPGSRGLQDLIKRLDQPIKYYHQNPPKPGK